VVGSRRTAVAEFLARYGSACEVGIGCRPEVARRLTEWNVTVTATDVTERSVPDCVRFVVDDVVAAAARDDPGEPYRAEVVYALDCPPELHRPLVDVARSVAERHPVAPDCLFTTLGGDEPAVPVARRALPGRETLYAATACGNPF
jgi:uncharacterized UPF0146 family protein